MTPEEQHDFSYAEAQVNAEQRRNNFLNTVDKTLDILTHSPIQAVEQSANIAKRIFITDSDNLGITFIDDPNLPLTRLEFKLEDNKLYLELVQNHPTDFYSEPDENFINKAAADMARTVLMVAAVAKAIKDPRVETVNSSAVLDYSLSPQEFFDQVIATHTQHLNATNAPDLGSFDPRKYSQMKMPTEITKKLFGVIFGIDDYDLFFLAKDAGFSQLNEFGKTILQEKHDLTNYQIGKLELITANPSALEEAGKRAAEKTGRVNLNQRELIALGLERIKTDFVYLREQLMRTIIPTDANKIFMNVLKRGNLNIEDMTSEQIAIGKQNIIKVMIENFWNYFIPPKNEPTN